MNLYFLVEGKSEFKIYPAWLSYLVPMLQRVDFFDDVDELDYKIVNANGQPFYPEIVAAVDEINSIGNYRYFVICLDTEENTRKDVESDLIRFMQRESLVLESCELVLIIQKRCMETWLLGSRKIYCRNPQREDLREYIQYYDVCVQNPEEMGKFPGFNTCAQFHKAYLKALLSEKRLSYTEKFPGHTMDETYLQQLLTRIRDFPDHLLLFQVFVDFCRQLNLQLKSVAW